MTAVAADEVGRMVDERTVACGSDELLEWASTLGVERLWALEDCRRLTRWLECQLLAAGEELVRVPPKLMAPERRHGRARGKSDPIDALAVARAAIRDRDSKFSRAFDDVFRSEGVEIVRTPYRAPNANAFAERWVGTVRRDCLDWLLIASRKQLERVLRVYVEHYNTHRPHRALGLKPPTSAPRLQLIGSNPPGQIQRRERLGGLTNEYTRAA